jgi:uncharacterized protein YraI
MKKRCLRKKLYLALILLLVAAGTVSCTREMAAGPRAWIDFPSKGATLSPGESVTILSHAAAREGIAEIVLSINGEAYRRDAPAEAGVTFTEFSQEWTPTEPGTYTLQVRAYDSTGEVSSPATVSVRVSSAMTVTPVTGECAADELVAPVLVAPADGATVAPDPVLVWSYPDDGCHPYSYTIDISEDPSFADVSWGFGTLDHLETSRSWPLPAGTCYYWRAKAYVPDTHGPESGVRSFCVEETPLTITPTFTPTPVEEEEAAPTCPPVAAALSGANCRSGPSPDYPVIASLAAGQEATVVGRNADSSWWVLEYPSAAATCWVWGEIVSLSTDTCDVSVVDAPPLPPTETPTPTVTPTTPAPDTTPPSAPTPQSPANDTTFTCSTTSVDLTWSAVEDESSIATYYIKLEKQDKDGKWISVRGYTSNTNQLTNVTVKCDNTYRWAVRAEDGAGNVSDWSTFFQFSIVIG